MIESSGVHPTLRNTADLQAPGQLELSEEITTIVADPQTHKEDLAPR
jgi:hypothetical protein